jgi:small-conductance mechanosensitive channel
MDHLTTWLQHHGFRMDVVFTTALILIAASVGILFVNRLLRRLLQGIQARFRLSSELVLFVTRALSSVLWVCVGLLILDVWGVSVAGLWAFLVSLAAVIGVGFLAVWTMVSNITASLFITIWRHFRLGETLEILPEGLKGRAIDRNFMFTVLREKESSLLQIPNNFFFQRIFRVSDNHEPHVFEFLESSRRPRADRANLTSAQDGRVRADLADRR